MDTLALRRETIEVSFDDIGEGLYGDYDRNNPDDVRLLRFDVSRYECGAWEAIPDASFCTQVPTDTPLSKQADLLAVIMDAVFIQARNGDSIKKVCERLSWLDETGSYLQKKWHVNSNE